MVPRVSPGMPTTSPVALVTGGASGIGRALCLGLAADGVTVIAADLDLDGARETVARITGAGGRAEAERVDVSDAGEVDRLVRSVVSRHGRLDFMFNNAGVVLAGEVLEMTPEHWRWILGVNLHGVIHGTLAAYRVMAEQGFGHIVNTASAAGLMPSPMCAAYAASKHAVVGLSASLRDEARWHGVKVSVACPVFVATPLFEHAVGIGVSLGEMTAPFLKYALSPERAARAILRGVRRNRAVILFPFYARVLLWCYRYLPGFARLGGRRMVAAFHQAREVREKKPSPF